MSLTRSAPPCMAHSGVRRRSGLASFPGNVLKDLFVQAQFSHQPLEASSSPAPALQPLRLVHLQTAIFLAPAVVGLFCKSGFLARCLSVLPLAIATSICRSTFTICSGVCRFPHVLSKAPSIPVCLIHTGTEFAGHSRPRTTRKSFSRTQLAALFTYMDFPGTSFFTPSSN